MYTSERKRARRVEASDDGDTSARVPQKVTVLPRELAKATLLYRESKILKERVHTLEEHASKLGGRVGNLSEEIERMEVNTSLLRDILHERQAEEEELGAELDILLNCEEETIATERSRCKETHASMQAACERVLYLEAAVRENTVEAIIAELCKSPPSSIGSPGGSQSSEGRDGVEFGPDDWIEGVLTPLHSPSPSPLVTPDANTTDGEEDDTAPREGSTGDNDDSESHMTSAKEPQSEEEAAGDQSVALVPFPTGEPVPEWFKGAFRRLNVSIGGHYLELVGHWVVIERLKGWKTRVRGLDARSRPQDLRKFMSSGKNRWDYGPHMGETFVGTFSSSVRTWWRFLRTEKDWRGLNRCGQSGWCLLLVCMKWWATGIADMEDGEEKKAAETEWILVLEEMNEAAQGLKTYLESEAEA
ncbi:hypothetical protein AAF712_015708 [Marasmius tenuissimus]|uniref:Uncharacterized protein n=1 Tax=Marasmius tenuissimus TaxID=585030 RepID=A0ABR2Z8R6_9AGAR